MGDWIDAGKKNNLSLRSGIGVEYLYLRNHRPCFAMAF